MSTFGESGLVAIVVVLAILVVIFLIIREVLCWYWKINQAITLLTEIRDLLAKKGSVPISSAANSGSTEGHDPRGMREPSM